MNTYRITSAIASACLAACAPDASEAPIVDSSQTSRGALQQLPIEPICRPPQVDVDARRSLTVTDHNILVPSAGGRDFSLRRVLAQLASQAGEPGGANELFRQLWDTQNPPGRFNLNLGFNCEDSAGNPSVVNGFDYGCRFDEGGQADNNFASTLDAYEAVALVNRFDLAPADGSNCGEYRIVFENGRGDGRRAFLIMEAVLPNPNPRCGIAACRPVQQMWADLTGAASASSRADDLEAFYFDGLPGFAPVVHYEHFLNGGGNCAYGECATGQFRTNTFIDRPWMLKEFKLERTCRSIPIIRPVEEVATKELSKSIAKPAPLPATRTICDLNFVPVSVKDNPFPDLFNATSTHPLAASFVNHIDDQVACLAVNDVNGFGFCGLDDTFNHNESAVDFFASDYRQVFDSSIPSALNTSIQNTLTSIGSALTPDDIVARAEAMSCKGCHQHSNNDDLGGEVTFPSSMGFVHNSEFVEPGPDGDRFIISSALTGTFLPFREGIMESYLSQSACVACGNVAVQSAVRAPASPATPAAVTISGSRAIH